MPSNYKTPGVYVQEISTLPASVAAVETAIPAFIGYTAIDPGEPVKISSMLEFEQTFGGPNPASVTLTLTGGSVAAPVVDNTHKLYNAMRMFFANGGGRCYVVSTGVFTTPNKDHFLGNPLGSTNGALPKLRLEDEPTMIVMPDALSLSSANYFEVAKEALKQCADLQDRFAIVDIYDAATDLSGITSFRSTIGTQNMKYGATYFPYLKTTLSYPDTAITLAGDAPLAGATLATRKAAAELETTSTPLSDALALYQVPMRDALATLSITVAPSSSMAGIYTTVDNTRGVWKAPANISLNGVVAPTVPITNDQQDGMNDDASGKAVNAIRSFTGKGILVWGARTLAANDLEWRYIPVRRLFIMAEESIKKASEFVVFEPNDANTWQRVKGMIENFLTGLWRDGALAGATPQEAYFVNCGLGTSMTSQDILEGNLIIEVGMAAVRPAEFIILKFSHKLQES